MLSHIVVPLDGSPFGEQVLPLAVHLAERHHAELELVHVVEALAPYEVQGAPPIDPALDSEIVRERQRYLERTADSLRTDSSVAIQSCTLAGSDVVETLTAHLAQVHADLVVVATHDHDGLSKFSFGGLPSGLVHSADAPVLLVPGSEAAESDRAHPIFKKVLLPLDGSMDEEAIDDALGLVAPNDADFILLNVQQPVASYEEEVLAPDETPEIEEADTAVLEPYAASELEAGTDEYLEGVAQRIRSRGFTATAEVINDRSPAKAILTVADAWDVDLIVVESHAADGIGRFLHSRIADKIIRGAHVPVLAHRHPIQ